MSDQPDGNSKVPLKEYLESRIIAVEKATVVALTAMDKRLEGMNEFREALTRQEGTFVTRKELDLVMQGLKEDKRSSISLWISIAAVLISLAAIVIKIIH